LERKGGTYGNRKWGTIVDRETLMSRYKRTLGDRLSARLEETQFTEITIKLDILNRILDLGSYKITYSYTQRDSKFGFWAGSKRRKAKF
jgi:hypothetical protein